MIFAELTAWHWGILAFLVVGLVVGVAYIVAESAHATYFDDVDQLAARDRELHGSE